MSGNIREIFTNPLSPFERENIHALVKLHEYKEDNNGELPDWRWVERLQHRQEINPARFERWHPNIPKLLCEPPPIDCFPGRPPVDDCKPICHIPPRDCPPSVIPEPSSYVLLAISVVLFVILKKMV